jgi:hypothetical protein
MPLQKIRLELARDKEFPNGSPAHGYEFVAPLGRDGKIDAAEWQRSRDECRVVRFWGAAEHEHGRLVRRPGGDWAFHYLEEGAIDVDDESGFRFDDHVFRPGEYVSIREDGEVLRTFNVRSVSDVSR